MQTYRSACELCGRPATQRHHVFFGTANRKKSEEWGMVARLCLDCHTGQGGVHLNRQKDLALKRKYQTLFEMKHSKKEFMEVFGRNYL